MPNNEADIINNAKNMLKMHEDEMKEKYRALSIGVGHRIEKGKMTDKIALIFYVEKKKTKEEMLSEGIQVIPLDINGIETQVIEVPHKFSMR